jgi:acyl CoA:acetate/3-ketoacid CoA transferase alpha subunit
MKIRYIAAPLAIAASAAAIGFAPVALANGTVQQNNGNTQQNSGNSQLVATPGQSAGNAAILQQPFGGNSGALLYHRR